MPPQSSGLHVVQSRDSYNMLGEEEDFVSSEATEIFHNMVREYTICALTFISVYLLAHFLINYYKRCEDGREEMWTDKDDHAVYRITIVICTFSCAIAIAATLLLPLSIVSNEVKLRYPHSIYIEWLNGSLIAGLWNSVSLFTNAAIFILLPFGYLFTESQGFAGSRKGLLSRVYETVIIFVLFAICLLGLSLGTLSLVNLLERRTFTDIFLLYLPLLFSAINFFGVLLLLFCNPVGNLHVLYWLWQQLKITLQRLIDDSSHNRDIAQRATQLEFDCQVRRAARRKTRLRSIGHFAIVSPLQQNGFHSSSSVFAHEISTSFETPVLRSNLLARTALVAISLLVWLFLTFLEGLYVARHTVEVLTGARSLPNGVSSHSLGVQSLSSLGWLGAVMQCLLILHILLCSLAGLYAQPCMTRWRPRPGDTDIGHLLLNALCLLLVSSALPVQSRLLGITHFTLLGSFGRMDWLGNIWLVLAYNLIFGLTTALAVLRDFFQRAWPDLVQRFHDFITHHRHHLHHHHHHRRE